MSHDSAQNLSKIPLRIQVVTVGLLLLCFVLVATFSIAGKSKTSDENSHYLYGRNILIRGDATRFDDSKMPITALNAAPRKFGRNLPTGIVRSFLQEFLAARLVTILFSTSVALVVFFWSRALYGVIPALFSLALYLFDPNIIAHSRLVTTDIYAAGTTIFVFFSLWRFSKQRNLPNGLLCALSMGLSLIAKYSTIALLPLAFLTLFIFDFPKMRQAYGDHQKSIIKKYLQNYMAYLVITMAILLMVVNIGFLSTRTFTRFSNYQFQSDIFRSIQQMPLIGKLPVPLPYPYLEGLDMVIRNERTGASYGNIYLLGQIRNGNEGFIGYYFIASLLKVPIASQLIYLLAILVYVRDRHRRDRFFADELFLFIPVLFFVIYFNFFFNTQIGIRYYLVVFPFLYIFSGHLFKNFNKLATTKKILGIGSMLYLMVSVCSYYPNFLPYFNEIVWNRSHAYRYLADSNIDWGQNSDELSRYLSSHPEAVYAPEGVQAGQIVLSVNQLTGVQGGPEKYEWLRNNFEPVDTISYTYLVYQISPDEIGNLCRRYTEYCS